jgi:hypothetical protein
LAIDNFLSPQQAYVLFFAIFAIALLIYRKMLLKKNLEIGIYAVVIISVLAVAEGLSAIIFYFLNIDLGLINRDVLIVVAGGLLLLVSLDYLFREIRK